MNVNIFLRNTFSTFKYYICLWCILTSTTLSLLCEIWMRTFDLSYFSFSYHRMLVTLINILSFHLAISPNGSGLFYLFGSEHYIWVKLAKVGLPTLKYFYPFYSQHHEFHILEWIQGLSLKLDKIYNVRKSRHSEYKHMIQNYLHC